MRVIITREGSIKRGEGSSSVDITTLREFSIDLHMCPYEAFYMYDNVTNRTYKVYHHIKA